MPLNNRTYSVLVVSSSDKFNTVMRELLTGEKYASISIAPGIAAAKRKCLEKTYDFVIINAPLPDDFGTKLAIDLSQNKGTVCLILVQSEFYEGINYKVEGQGVFTLSKPTSKTMIDQALRWMITARERMRKMEKKTVSIEEKMEEIRLVNRAKWALIENLKMTEPDAHRYIEKQAMDQCVSRREIADHILKTYA